LATELDVSAQTIRRDIISLDAAGLLQRFHGGAGNIDNGSSVVRLGHQRKQDIAQASKIAIARQVAKIIPQGATVFLDVGTTIEAAAHELSAISGLTIFTNSLKAGMIFRPDQHNVHILGGLLGGNDGSIVGASVVRALDGLRIDYALIGCSAIEPNGAVMDFDLDKIEIKKAAMRIASVKCLLASSHKFGRSALAQIAKKEQFDYIFSD
jgi:DeoR family glycerol-3-phosphate regulon repressor